MIRLNLNLTSGKIRQLTVVGIVQDQTIGVTSIGGGFFTAPAQGYISTDSLEWLEQPDAYNMLYVTAADGGMDAATLRALSEAAREEIEDSGYYIYSILTRTSEDHPNSTYANAMTGTLFMLGFFVVFLSSFLITNTLSALLNQQVQQIGTMKTIGATSRHIIQIYITLIVLYGVIAFVVAVPLSAQASFAMARFISEAINTEVLSLRITPLAVILQAVLAVLVPILAGLGPILRGSSITIQQAISGLDPGRSPSAGPLHALAGEDTWHLAPVDHLTAQHLPAARAAGPHPADPHPGRGPVHCHLQRGSLYHRLHRQD